MFYVLSNTQNQTTWTEIPRWVTGYKVAKGALNDQSNNPPTEIDS